MRERGGGGEEDFGAAMWGGEFEMGKVKTKILWNKIDFHSLLCKSTQCKGSWEKITWITIQKWILRKSKILIRVLTVFKRMETFKRLFSRVTLLIWLR